MMQNRRAISRAGETEEKASVTARLASGMAVNPSSRQGRTATGIKTSGALSLLALLGLAVASLPWAFGVRAHEWVGLSLVAVVLAHAAVSWHSRPARSPWQGHHGIAVMTRVIDVACGVALVVCAVSGIMVSGEVLPRLGYYVPDGFFFWDPLHAASAKAAVALALLHVMTRAGKAVRTVRRALDRCHGQGAALETRQTSIRTRKRKRDDDQDS